MSYISNPIGNPSAGGRNALIADTDWFVRSAPETVTVTIASPGVVHWVGHGLIADDAVVFARQWSAYGSFTMSIANPAVITKVGHGLIADQPFTMETDGNLPSGGVDTVSPRKWYYVVNVLTADTFTFAELPAGTEIDTTGGSQAGNHELSSADVLPDPLIQGTIYFVKTVIDVDNFTLTDTLGGAVINTSGAQQGTHAAQTGNDNNDGLSLDSPFLTIQRACDVVSQNYDLRSFNATINVSHGNYSEAIVLLPYVGAPPNFYVDIVGDTTNWDQCVVVNAGNTDIFHAVGVGSNWRVRGFQVGSDTVGGGGNAVIAFRAQVGAALIIGEIEYASALYVLGEFFVSNYAINTAMLFYIGDFHVSTKAGVWWFIEQNAILSNVFPGIDEIFSIINYRAITGADVWYIVSDFSFADASSVGYTNDSNAVIAVKAEISGGSHITGNLDEIPGAGAISLDTRGGNEDFQASTLFQSSFGATLEDDFDSWFKFLSDNITSGQQRQYDVPDTNVTMLGTNDDAEIFSQEAMADVAGAGLGTLTNAPHAGDPDKWITWNENGTKYGIPIWVLP